MKKVKAVIEIAKDGFYSIYIDDNNLEYGVTGEGETIAEAKNDFDVSYTEMKQLHEKNGWPFTEIEYSYCYDVVSLLQYYAQYITLVGLSRITGINKCQLSHYINGTSRPGARTVQKLQEGFTRFGGELSSVQFS